MTITAKLPTGAKMEGFTRPHLGSVDLTRVDEHSELGRQAAEQALGPASALLDDSAARATATQLRQKLEEAAQLVPIALEQRETFLSDQTTRPEIVGQARRTFGEALDEKAKALHGELGKLAADYEQQLQQEVLPQPASDVSALLARQEIEMAAAQAPDTSAKLRVLADFAARGGEYLAQAASPWGKLVAGANADDEGLWRAVVFPAVVKGVTAGDDEGRKRAAAALQAIYAGKNGGAMNRAVTFARSNANTARRLFDVPKAGW